MRAQGRQPHYYNLNPHVSNKNCHSLKHYNRIIESDGCSISSNIKIGQQACQLQVFPAGREVELQGQIEGGDVVNVSSEGDEDSGVIEEETVDVVV